MREHLYRGLVLIGLAIIIILLILRGSCGCGTNPWAFFIGDDDEPRIDEVFDNDPQAP